MLLLYIYVAAFVIGGILLGASLFLGGHDTDTDAHVGYDAAAGGGHGGPVGHDHGAGPAGAQGFSPHDLWLPFVSIRFWVFFLCFFGLTGVVFHLLALSGTWATRV